MPNPLLPEYSLPGAAERAQLLVQLLGNQSKTVMDLNAAVYAGQALSLSFFNPVGGALPGYYWFTYGTDLVVLLLGVGTATQGARVSAGYLSPASGTPFGGYNQFFFDYANSVAATITGIVEPPMNITIIGHSAGGAAAFILAKLLFATYSTLALTKVITFGAPKTCTRQTTTNYDPFFHCTSCAWMTFDDPIPLLPPTTLTWTFAYGTGYLGGQQARVQSFIPSSKGKIVQSNLTISDGNVPPGLTMPSTADFGAWFALFGTAPDSPHTMRTYLIRLLNAVALTPPPLPPPTPVPVPPAPPPPTPTAVREAYAAQRATYTQQEGRQNATIPTYPESALFAVVKQGNMWKVAFGGVIVGVGPGRKTAQGLARDGNAFIKRMQSQGGVDAFGLAEQFTTLMAMGTEPTSGFSPNFAPLDS